MKGTTLRKAKDTRDYRVCQKCGEVIEKGQYYRQAMINILRFNHVKCDSPFVSPTELPITPNMHFPKQDCIPRHQLL